MKTVSPAEIADPNAPNDGWYIIEAAGEHPSRTEDGTVFTQRLTEDVLGRIVEAGIPAEGLPIDCDHQSLTPDGRTAAVGWLKELALCEGNLAGRIEWTPPGKDLIIGKIYKHFSTVYPPLPENCTVYEPQRLEGLALTNRPNNATGQPPLCNTTHFRAEQQSAENQTTEDQTQNKMEITPQIMEALGLAEGATEEEILEAINALKDQVANAEATAEETAEREAEAIVANEEAASGVELPEEEREEAKEQVLANRDHGLKYLRLLCNSRRPAQTTFARRYAGNPVANARRIDPAETRRTAVLNRANDIIQDARARGQHVSFWNAKAQAEREINA